MYAGKTTELLRNNILNNMGLRCVYVNSSQDNRSDKAFQHIIQILLPLVILIQLL